MISGTVLLLGAFVALIYFVFLKKPKWKNAPPGPSGFPVVGNLFQMDKHNHLSFTKWAKEYGPICKIDLASMRMVIVSDYKLVKEIFAEPAFSGRMDFSNIDFIMDGKVHGLANTEGEHWEELRRFTLRQLRDFGFGKNTMEESIMTEVTELIDGLKEHGEKPLEDIKLKFTLAVVNSLWSLCTGIKYKQNDEELIKMTEDVNKAFHEVQEGGSIILFMPWLTKVMPVWSGYEKVKREILKMADSCRKPMLDHKKTYHEDFDRDFTDVFLKEIRKTTDPNSAFMGKLGEDNLVATLGDLFFAGTDTTASTLAWMMLYLSKFPEVQRKFHKEIETTTGNSRMCAISDRPNMPYTEAVIAETLRFSSITPQGLGHKAMKDQEFHGYLIPKDTIITANIFHIHFDPTIWGDPENFRPERFLSPDGKTFKKHEALLPFSIGRRQCLGETLARDSLFLFATNVVQRFKIEFDTKGPDHGFEPVISFILTPMPFNLILKDRLA
ncbi:methyl farnesoate epoxidase [Folsomia candida]|uniref:Methyl farnesoate epoxidase n=1 Tax=Folsomia candida TaxID=158441 RepID=A0A226DEQ8_FOLCA|nr:methyl farnesoate epoxidase [Folsomia candida]OXA43620.1 Methyl farnesoate epoxidase [Folsomia candida]